jgi:hypothetical protein
MGDKLPSPRKERRPAPRFAGIHSTPVCSRNFVCVHALACAGITHLMSYARQYPWRWVVAEWLGFCFVRASLCPTYYPTEHTTKARCKNRAQRRNLVPVHGHAGLPVPMEFLKDTPDPLFLGCFVEVKINPTGDWIRARSPVSVVFSLCMTCDRIDTHCIGFM